MAGANRVVRKVSFTHSGEAATLSKVIEMPESAGAGVFDIWHRRVLGSGEGYIESIYGSFESSGENGYQLGIAYTGWADNLTPVRWYGDDNQFPYLKIEADFDSDDGSTTVEVYITCF